MCVACSLHQDMAFLAAGDPTNGSGKQHYTLQRFMIALEEKRRIL